MAEGQSEMLKARFLFDLPSLGSPFPLGSGAIAAGMRLRLRIVANRLETYSP